MRPLAALLAPVRRALRQRKGAVTLVTALSAPILLMIVGFAVDYGYASYLNQRLTKAMDAATLAAVSQSAATAAGGYGNLTGLRTAGLNIFAANTDQLSVTGVTFNLSVVSDGSTGVIANASYTLASPTFFSKILGFSTIPLAGNATTSARPPTYINYYILVDTSQSMGIGTTQADMTALYNRVKAYGNAASSDGGCVFGCHMKSTINGKPQPYTNEDLAHNTAYGTPITLRIDSAVTAIQTIIQSAASIAATTKNIKFGLYSLANDPDGSKVQNVTYPATNPTFTADPPSTDYASLLNAAGTIDLDDITTNTGQTDLKNAIAQFLSNRNPAIVQGTGASAASPLNYVFLITDGLNDIPGNCNNFGVCTSAFDSTSCTSLKSVATVGVIYTTYLPIYQYNTAPTLETRYSQTGASSVVAQIPSALQSCATSSDWFFQADDGPTLISNMQTLFAKAQPLPARLSQ